MVCPDVLGVAQASTTFVLAEPVDAEALFQESPTFRTGSLDDCKRMHMPELRVCAFHLNAHAFQSGITAGKNALTKILITAVADQVDVIACDVNQFTNRDFRSDRHSDPALTRFLFQRTRSASQASGSLMVGRFQPLLLSSSLLWKVRMPIATACCRSPLITARTCTRCGAGHPIFRKTVAESITKACLFSATSCWEVVIRFECVAKPQKPTECRSKKTEWRA